MLKLQELIDCLQTRETTVRGRTITLRALRESESDQLSRVFPHPKPQRVKDKDRGSLAPKVDDEDDPEYREAVRLWNAQRFRLEIGVSGGFEVLVDGQPMVYREGMEDSQAKAILSAIDTTVARAFTSSEINRLWDEMSAIFDESKQDRIRQALIIDLKTIDKGEVGEAAALPKEFATTRLYWTLKFCRAYGIDPRTILDMQPGMVNLLIEAEKVFDQESIRRSCELAAGSRV